MQIHDQIFSTSIVNERRTKRLYKNGVFLFFGVYVYENSWLRSRNNYRLKFYYLPKCLYQCIPSQVYLGNVGG